MKNLTLLLLLIIGYTLSFAQPVNDACPNPILIPNVNNFCSVAGAGTNVNATDDVATSGGFGAAGCWGGTVHDVWFSFVAIATDVSITINGNQGSPTGGTLNRPQVALYSGTCSGTINELVCGSPPSGQHIIQIYRGGLTIGQTYLIRVDGVNTNRGTFQYCINNYFPVPAPDGDCPTAVVLCDKNNFTVPDVTGAGSVVTEMNGAACFNYDPFTGNVESSSTWYAFTFATSGTFNFVINPSNPSDDIDFALYRLPNGVGNCGGKVTVRCMAASCAGSTGIRASSSDTDEPPGCSFPSDNYVSQVNVTAGQTYALAINNFTSTGNGFSISFGGTANFQGPTAIINDSDADDQLCPGDPITFTDVSTPPPSGSLVTWTWNFGVGASPATFSGQNPPAVTYSSIGTKTISLTVTSDRGCFVTATKVITVATVPPTVSIAASQNPICAGTNVTFTATPTNSGASPTYQWYLNNIAVGTNSNTYSNAGLNTNDQIKVQVTSNSACNSGQQATSNIITMTINAPVPANVTITGITSVCQGISTTLTANPTNGGASPTYQWFVNSNPVGTNSNTYSSTFTNGDIVTVRLTSNFGCVSNNPVTSANFPITVKPNPIVSVNSPSICNGQTASLTASGATTYSWTGGLSANATPSTPILTTTTTYTVTGTTNGCTGTAVSTVTVKPKPTITVNSPSICRGQTANLTASGASSYSWTGGLTSTSNPTTPILTTTTTYTVTGTLNGCTGTAALTVTVKPNPTVSVNSPSVCNGQTASLTATGATTYSWTGGLTAISNPTTPILTTTTTYTVTGTTNGCTGTAVSTVTVKPNPIVSVNSPSICNGQTASLTASGATTYSWTGGLSSNATPSTPILTTTTTYTVTGTTNGCTGTAVSAVTVKPKPTISVNSPSICSGQTANLTASGASSYSWTGGLTPTSNPITPILTTTTTYTVTGTLNGCTGTAALTVTVKPNPTVNVNSPGICNGQTANLTASGASTYSWTGGLTAISNPTTPILTTTTTYTVTGTTNGCTGTAVSTVTVKPNPIVSVNSPSICNGQTASLTASGATTYSWTGGLSSNATPSTPILTTTTTYTVTGTTNGCTGTAVSAVTVKPKPTITVNSPSICSSQTANLTASGASSYSWTGGLTPTSNPITPILTTTTTYTVTGTQNGCTGTAALTVTVKPNPTVSVNSPGICNGQTANLTASGATTYSWTGGLSANATPSTPILTTTTTYTVTGTTNGCTGSAVSTVTVKPNPIVGVNSPSICNGQTAILTASGATTYSWTGGLSANATPSTPILTTTTTYTVTGTTNGCRGTAVSTVTVKPNPVISVNSPIICNGQSAILIASGASSYSWTGGLAAISNPTTPVLNTNTNYTVTGTSNGCTGRATTTIKIKPTKVTNLNKSICSGDSVVIGTQSFNATGNYSVVLSSSENCDSTVNLALLVSSSLTPSVSISENKNNICLGEQAVFTATSINTGNAVNYQWFVNGNTVGTNSNKFTTNSLVNGDVVTVGISTSASCLTTNTATSNAITMTVNSVSFTIPNVEYCNGKSATVDLNIPLTNYSVFWKNGTDTITTNNDILTVNNTTNASLQFTVKFGIGCTKSGVVPIKVNQLPFINATVDIADAKYEEVVQLSANGNSITQYNWLPVSSVSEDSIKNPTAIITSTTIFTVNVKDANQCENSDTVLVRLINECLNEFIYLPTAFSPNRDGVNDCFGIISPPKLTDFTMTIFNRWGEKVFESSDKDNCWDGMYKGVEALSDSYVYLIGFKCYNGTDLSKKGTITIIR
jgi:gliding motility-associated-like protein